MPGKWRLVAAGLSMALLAGCSALSSKAVPAVKSDPPAPAPTQPAPDPAPIEARILAVGDLLMHTPLVYASQTGDDQWDFTPLFSHVRPWLEGADFATANLETTLTGKAYPWSGYPSFNTPQELARDAKAVGFDAITHANNHALDYDEYGLRETYGALERYGMPHTGTARTPEEAERILVVEVKPGIKMALLSYTYATNGVPLPHPWSVNMLDPDRVRADVRRARQMPDVDLVAVAMHAGDEYAKQPNEQQEQMVQLMLDAGADIIFGNHPHVVQHIEVRQVKDELGRDLPRAIIYSLGNFIGNQVGVDQEESLMFVVDVRKEKGVTRVTRVSFVPTWTHPYTQDGKKKFRTVAVEKAIRDYEAKADPLISAADYERLKEVWADTTARAVGGPDVHILHVDEPIMIGRKP